jgi:hypothetical protein
VYPFLEIICITGALRPTVSLHFGGQNYRTLRRLGLTELVLHRVFEASIAREIVHTSLPTTRAQLVAELDREGIPCVIAHHVRE